MLRVVEKPSDENQKLRATLDDIHQRGALSRRCDARDGSASGHRAVPRDRADCRGGTPPRRETRNVSCSWHKHDEASSLAVCGKLIRDGFRLIGDAVDRRGFGKGESVRRIMSSCRAVRRLHSVSRGVGSANAVDKPYKYFIQEMDDALAAGLPRVIVSDPRVKRTDGPVTVGFTWSRTAKSARRMSQRRCPICRTSGRRQHRYNTFHGDGFRGRRRPGDGAAAASD